MEHIVYRAINGWGIISVNGWMVVDYLVRASHVFVQKSLMAMITYQRTKPYQK